MIHERRAKPGELNEFGIATCKATDNFAQREVDWRLKIGGIELRIRHPLGQNVTLDALRARCDAAFLGIGPVGVNALRAPCEDLPGLRNAVDFIEDLRRAADKSALPVGREVVVIGGGMTALDAAVPSNRLRAENVTIVSRRRAEKMSASACEQDHAKSVGAGS